MSESTEAQLNERIRELERKYVQLLEARLQDLTARTITGQPASEDKTTTDNADDEKKKETTKKDEESASDDTKHGRYRVVLNQLNEESGEYVDKPAVAVQKDDLSGERAFTFRKYLTLVRSRGSQSLKTSSSEFEIDSESLQKLLKKVTRQYSEPAKITQMSSPFEDLIWSWEEAEREANTPGVEDTEDERQARLDLKEMMRLISTSSGIEDLDKYFKAKDSLAETKTVLFESIWTIFPKGSYIVARPFLKQPQVFIVESYIIDDFGGYGDESYWFLLTAYSYDWDGSSFNRVPYQFEIPSFSNRKLLSELPVIPLKDCEGEEALRAALIERGRRFQHYCTVPRGKETFGYDDKAYHERGTGLFRLDSGATLDPVVDAIRDVFSSNRRRRTETGAEDLGTLAVDKILGSVVVDFKSYHAYQTADSPMLGPLKRHSRQCRKDFIEIYRSDWDGRSGADTLSDEQYMSFPPRVLGYSLAKKQWVQLNIEGLRDAEAADSTTFDNKLQLKREHKEIIKKSVLAHGKRNITDLIHGKGRALVILLWGVPGVGKTLTAESMAKLAGKPLFSVGASDIGLEGPKVETNLEKVFDLAALWQAVLLFDEADVFLESRGGAGQGADIQRNTIVSVLLRVLEYYEGILILTTNRLRSLDIAVQSRIHIAIEFGDLDADQRRQIYLEFLTQLKGKDLIEARDWDGITDWVEEEGITKDFNGRQIRNLVSTAMALAHGHTGHLTRKNLSDVASNTSRFKGALAAQEAIYRSHQIQSQYPRL